MNKKAVVGFSVVASAVVVGAGLMLFGSESDKTFNDSIETLAPQAGDVDAPHIMMSTESYPQTPLAAGPFINASECRDYMERHLRSVQAGLNDPTIASNPIQLAVKSENIDVKDTTRAMFTCRPSR